ncbi:MAG TPA: hypothetical protein PKK33_10025, partial [Candidatus Cloacimonadota bacterium]|nr:hypothetical protein [Candidatus Cloacimonadota bacterium]
GVLYIASVEPNRGIGEIGCFPSIDPVTLEKVNDYNPLYNFMKGNETYPSGTRVPFRTKLFDWKKGTELDMFAAPSYDMSVDIYIADFVNPNLLINTGFNQDFLYTNRVYNETSFPYGVRHIKTTDKHPHIEFRGLTNNGNNMPGNYFLFFRYVSESFDRTAFLSEIGPIAVHVGDTAIDIEGLTDEMATPTNKEINLYLTNLDQEFKYIEVGVWKYHGPGIASAAIREQYLIHKYYVISSDQMIIAISGNEERETLTEADILNTNNIPPISKTHTVADNIYFGANWKDIDYSIDALREFASKIYPSIVYQSINDMTIEDYVNKSSMIPQYKNPNLILGGRTHFRGEIYPYAIQFILSTGKELDAIPIMSCRYSSLMIPQPVADGKGLIEIPDFVYGSFRAAQNNLSKAIGLKMELANALEFKDKNPDLFINVIGFRFVRGSRKENTLYQGWVLPCFNQFMMYGETHYMGENNLDSGSDITESESLFMPLPRYRLDQGAYDGLFPTSKYVENPGAGIDQDTWLPALSSKQRYALFSPDYMMNEVKHLNDLTTYYVKKIASYSMDDFLKFHKKWNNIYFQFEVNDTSKQKVSFNPQPSVQIQVKNTYGNRFKEGDQWTTMLKDYEIDNRDFGFYYNAYSNRTIYSQRYIGIIPNESIDLKESFVAIRKYKDKETYWSSIYNQFEAYQEMYNVVSEMITFTSPTAPVLFSGDGFLNRTIFRANHWRNIPDKFTDDEWYPHAYVMSFISENRVNTQMRCDVETTDLTYTYFPKCLSNDIFNTLEKWAITEKSDDVKVEAMYVNTGYNECLSGKKSSGYNFYIPYRALKYPNRVYWSGKQIPGSFINDYRIFGVNSYVDFGWEDGPINSIRELYGRLITVTDRSINEHIFNESQYRVPTSLGEIILGTSDVLAKVKRRLTNYGSKFTSGVLVTDTGIVGIDTMKNIIWRIIGSGG